jgi:hypothetical protein
MKLGFSMLKSSKIGFLIFGIWKNLEPTVNRKPSIVKCQPCEPCEPFLPDKAGMVLPSAVVILAHKFQVRIPLYLTSVSDPHLPYHSAVALQFNAPRCSLVSLCVTE